ncbi:MAG: hypothetical protein DME25_10515 [Verrucomicrobia bacterium]|nr:MAG: hypothetical protein DME25_10515 [Verrucomicrobiota bacterium]
MTIGQLAPAEAEPALFKILLRDYEYRWTRVAVFSSLQGSEAKWLTSLLTNGAFHTEIATAKLDLIRELADLTGARARSADFQSAVSQVFNLLADAGRESQMRIAALEGLQSGLSRVGIRVSADAKTSFALEELSPTESPAVMAAVWKLSRALGLTDNEAQQKALAEALQRAPDATRPLTSRLEDIRLLSLGNYSQVGKASLQLLEGPQPGQVQQAAIEVLRQFGEADLATNLVNRWRSLAPPVRSQVVSLLLQRTSFHAALIEAIETGRLTVGELNLDLEQRRRLLRHSTTDVEARAARFITDEEYGHRKTVVDDWLKKLPPTGDAARGRAVFEKTCSPCHLLDGMGHAVGPDLASQADHSVEDLLSNILDPNMAINPGYVAYSVEMLNGESETGLLKSESPEAVQLLQAYGRQVVIPRSEIKQLRASCVSLMPEGLDAGLTPADLRDLIALIQLKH